MRDFQCKQVWCSKESSQWDGSFEYPQHMFWLRNKKNYNILVFCTHRFRPQHALCLLVFSADDLCKLFGPRLCLTKYWAPFRSKLLKKLILKKISRWQKKHEKLPSRLGGFKINIQIVQEVSFYGGGGNRQGGWGHWIREFIYLKVWTL